MDNGLAGKSVYAFGDSIVYGHVYPRSFADIVATLSVLGVLSLMDDAQMAETLLERFRARIAG